MTSNEVARMLSQAVADFVPKLENESAEDIGVVIIFTNDRLRRASMPMIGRAGRVARTISLSFSVLQDSGKEVKS